VADAKVIVIEPDRATADALSAVLRSLDYDPIVVARAEDLSIPAEGCATSVAADLTCGPAPGQTDWVAVLVGQHGARGAFRELLERLRALPQPLPVVNIGAGIFPALDGVPSLQLELPIRYPQLSAVLREAERLRATPYEVPPLLSAYRPSGQSRAIRAVHRLVEQVAPFDTNVLVLGESGTGKEMVARYLHELSPRAGKPFVPVNCGAIPADLLESELFGHEKGAFTGALSTRQGRFEMAEGGTLFLDEIGDMSLPMQVKLLRVLQERTFERVGSNTSRRCDVRIVAATHRDLEAAILAGQFREDLYYRLNVFPIQMPPLRERLDDLPVLTDHLLSRIGAATGKWLRLAPCAQRALALHRWPGNVRELANLLERLVILHPDSELAAVDLPERYRAGLASAAEAAPASVTMLHAASVATGAAEARTELPEDGLDLRDHLNLLEQHLIRQALERADGTVAEAARLLRLQRTTLVEKLRKYRLADVGAA
jgi:sigma-54 dependent transcriptional regulator, flagellar regulatory protein